MFMCATVWPLYFDKILKTIAIATKIATRYKCLGAVFVAHRVKK
jgi:hypothetical protein